MISTFQTSPLPVKLIGEMSLRDMRSFVDESDHKQIRLLSIEYGKTMPEIAALLVHLGLKSLEKRNRPDVGGSGAG